MKTSSLGIRYFVTIAIVSFATLATQILLSRILSVTLYYQFAFAGITFAMLGLTAGALRVYNEPEKYSAANAPTVLADYCARFAATLVLAVVLHLMLPAAVVYLAPGDATQFGPVTVLAIGVSLGLLLFAFIQSGVCVGLLLTRFPEHTNRLYASDLLGAASGCILIVVALRMFEPVGLLLMIAVLVAFTGWRLLPAAASKNLSLRVKIISGVLCAMCIVQVSSYALGRPAIRLYWAKNDVFTERPLFESWNTFSRVVVTEFPHDGPLGWGFGVPHHEPVQQKNVVIDAEASTVITKFDGDPKTVSYLQDDIINLGYHLRDMKNVAVIGVGGGRDILSALVAGAHVEGIELNPAIFDALTRVFGDFAGHLERRPDVKLVNAEARSYLNSHDGKYDLVQISLIDTWATTAAGGLTLSENKLYTTDAFDDFLARLNDNGMLVVSRWYKNERHSGELYRLLAIAVEALRTIDPNVDPRSHILVASVNSIATMALSKSPFTPEEVARFDSTCQRLNFTPLVTPTIAVDDIAAHIASGKADRAYFDTLPFDVTPTTDDRPFFFYTERLRNAFRPHEEHGQAAGFADAIVSEVLALTFFAGVIFIAGPMFGFYKRHHIELREAAPSMIFFGGIGLGFMLIEMSQMQRLMVFLGHPVYGLSVVLFVLLLASGIGSYLQQHIAKISSAPWFTAALVCAVLTIIGLLTPPITEHLKHYDNGARIIASALFMAPMGLVMGTMFPTGVAFASVKHAELLPWYWGINGAASVFASALGVALPLVLGIAMTFWIGVACYVMCLVAVVVSPPPKAVAA